MPRRPDLGPGVRIVIGADKLVSAHAVEGTPIEVAHLRTLTPGRHIMVLHDCDDSSALLPSLAERLLWLDGRAGAPELIASARSSDKTETLVIRVSADAVVASDPLVPIDPESMARLIGSALRTMHELPVDGCPFESSVGYWRGVAGERVARAMVDTQTSGPYAGLQPGRLLEVLDEMLDAASGGDDEDDRVLIHGWPRHHHTWLVPDGSLVFTGWQTFGIGDRHHDLAVAATDLARRFGPAMVPPLLDSYGFDRVRPARLDLHQLLVHLCGVIE